MKKFYDYTQRQESQTPVNQEFLHSLAQTLFTQEPVVTPPVKKSFSMKNIFSRLKLPLAATAAGLAVTIFILQNIGYDRSNGFISSVKATYQDSRQDHTGYVHYEKSITTGPGVSFPGVPSELGIPTQETWTNEDNSQIVYIDTLNDGTVVNHAAETIDHTTGAWTSYTQPEDVVPPTANDLSCILNNPSLNENTPTELEMIGGIQTVNTFVESASRQSILDTMTNQNPQIVDLGDIDGLRVFQDNTYPNQILRYHFDPETFYLKRLVSYAVSKEVAEQHDEPYTFDEMIVWHQTEYLANEYIPADEVDPKIWDLSQLMDRDYYWDKILEGKEESGCYNGLGEKVE